MRRLGKTVDFFLLARLRWAIGCGQSGCVDSIIGAGRGVGTLGSEAGTLGSDAHSLGIDDGSIGATLGGGGRMPGCVEIGSEGERNAAGTLNIARSLLMVSSWAWQLFRVLSAHTAVVRAWRQ